MAKTTVDSDNQNTDEVRHGFWHETIVAAALSLAVVLITTAHFAFPGTSARLITEVAGLARPEAIDMPLWRLVMRVVSVIPVLSLPWRLNIANAIFGTVAAGALYRFAALLVTDLLPIELSRPFVIRTARVAGSAAVASLLFSASGWSMVSHLSPAAFEFAVAAICLNLAADALPRPGLRKTHMLAAAAIGLFATGSGGLTIVLPFFIVAMLVTIYLNNDELRWSWTFSVMLSTGIGIALALSIAAMMSAGETAGGLAFLQHYLVGWWRQVVSQFPNESLFPMLCTGYLPFVLTLITSSDALSRRDFGLGCISFAMTIIAGAAFVGMPGFPWHLAGRFGSISMPPLLNSSLMCGILAAFWFERRSQAFRDWTTGGLEPMSGEKSSDDDDDDDEYSQNTSRSIRRFSGWVVLLCGATCVIYGAVRNFNSLHLWNGAFLDAVANQLLTDDRQDENPFDGVAIGPHILLAKHRRAAQIDGATADANNLGIFDDDFTIDDYSWIERQLGPNNGCLDIVDISRERIREKCSKMAVDCGVKALMSGDDAHAADFFREIAKHSPGNLSAFANWASMLKAGYGKDDLMASQEKTMLENAAEHLLTLHGNSPEFDAIISRQGEIVDPDALVEYGFNLRFAHGITNSLGYDAWEDDITDVSQEFFETVLSTPGNAVAVPDRRGKFSAADSSRLAQAAYNALRAHEALQQSDVKTAKEFFKRSNLSVANALALLGTAKCQLALGDCVSAEQTLDELFKMNPDGSLNKDALPVAWNLRSIAMLGQGRIGDAIAAARKAIACDGTGPNAIYPRLALARALAESNATNELRDVASELFKQIDSLPGEMRSEVISLYRSSR